MSQPPVIWLQPWCDDCERASAYDVGRCWSEDDPWGKCTQCDKMPVKYVLAPDQPVKPE